MKISFLKTSKTKQKKNLEKKFLKWSKIPKSVFKKMFLLLKYQKLLTFLVKYPPKKLSCFLGAFIWNHPPITVDCLTVKTVNCHNCRCHYYHYHNWEWDWPVSGCVHCWECSSPGPAMLSTSLRSDRTVFASLRLELCLWLLTDQV